MGTLIGWTALVVAGMALVVVWRLNRELEAVRSRLDRYNRNLFATGDQMRRLEEAVAAQAVQLRLLAGTASQPLPFSPTMTVAEAVAVHPQTEELLAGLHLGGCSSCAITPTDTLFQICRDNQVDLEQLLTTLNRLPSASTHTDPPLQPLKMPNVELSF